MREKLDCLTRTLQGYKTVAIAFSGGVDSVFLLQAAVDALGVENVVAITVRACNFPEREGIEAETFAKSLGVRHVVLFWDPLYLPEFSENSPRRCYYCKKEVFTMIGASARDYGAEVLVDGSNADDVDDYRPGTRAARELGVVSPLQECGLHKSEIRQLLRERGNPFWSKASFACLASRVPYGETITGEILANIETAEQFFLDLGFRNIRVRHHGDLARIEVEAADRERFFVENLWEEVDAALRRLGYKYVALDLLGYRTGSLNQGVTEV